MAKAMDLQTVFEPLLRESNDVSKQLAQVLSVFNQPDCDRITAYGEVEYDDEDNVNFT